MPEWTNIVLGGVALWPLAMALVWALDKVLNMIGYDLPDNAYTTYAKFVASVLIAVVAVSWALGIDVTTMDNAWKVLIAIITALGYEFGKQ